MNMLTNLPARLLPIGLSLGFACCSITQSQAQATPPSNPTITWIGAVDAIYTKPGNWNLNRAPNWMDNVIIPPNGTPVAVVTPQGPVTLTVSVQPVLDAALGIGTAGTLTIRPGAVLTLNPQSELDLFGDLIDDGTFSGMGALVVRSPTVAPATTPTPTIHTIGRSPGSTLTNSITISDLDIGSVATTNLAIPVSLMRVLTLSSTLNTSASGTLTLVSTPAVTAFVVNNGTAVVNGSVTVQRAIDITRFGLPSFAGAGYRHYSAPVSNTTVADFITSGFTPTLTQSYNTSPTPPATVPFPTVYGYDQALVNRVNSSPNFDKGWFVPLSLSTPLVAGQGYTVNIAGNQLVDFVGTLNNAPVAAPAPSPIAVQFGRNAASTVNSGDAGWVFLGNPFPSPMDYSQVAGTDRTGLDNAMYVYTSTSQYGGYYRAYSFTTDATNTIVSGSGIGNPVIPVGQAFFVHVTTPGTSGTFNFRNAQRLTTSDGTTFQRTAADQRPQLEMALHSSDKVVQDMLNVYFQAGSTADVDAQYDAVKPLNNNGMMLNTLTPSGQALAIDGRPLPTTQLTIPLELKVAVAGTYTLSTDKLLNMNALHVYLHDTKTGTMTDLAQQPEYTFSLSANNNTPRFELIFSTNVVTAVAPAALTRQVSLYPSPAKDVAFVELPASLGGEAITATLVDGLGRTVRTASLPAQGELTHSIKLAGLGTGLYVLRLHTSAGIVAKRLAIE